LVSKVFEQDHTGLGRHAASIEVESNRRAFDRGQGQLGVWTLGCRLALQRINP
jgi:hypothetical protein